MQRVDRGVEVPDACEGVLGGLGFGVIFKGVLGVNGTTEVVVVVVIVVVARNLFWRCSGVARGCGNVVDKWNGVLGCFVCVVGCGAPLPLAPLSPIFCFV